MSQCIFIDPEHNNGCVFTYSTICRIIFSSNKILDDECIFKSPLGIIKGNYYDKLGELGYSGSLADRQFKYFTDNNLERSTSERKFQHLRTLTYTGLTISEMLKQKTDSEFFDTVGQMMYRTGYIPIWL